MKKDGFIKTSDHGKIYFTEVGTGQPIIFVHGWSSTGENSFGHMAEALKDSARCIYFDLRGHGHSYTYNASSIGRLTDDLHDLIIELDLHDVILVGHSLGGLLIYDYFQKYDGARVAAVAVLDMSPKVLCDTEWDHGLRISEDPMASYMEHTMQTVTGEFMMMGGWALKAFSNMMSAISPVPFGSVLYTLWLDMLDADYREGARKIDVPMVYFYTENGMYPASTARWLRRNVKGNYKGIDLFPDNHFTMMLETEKIVSEIRGLLKK